MNAADPRAQRASVSVSSGPFVGPVLSRFVGMLAARADLPVDRLDDAVLVADSIAASAPAHSLDGRVSLAVETGDRRLELHVGPLAHGGAKAMLADASVPGVGNVVERLVDEVWVTGEGESPDAAGAETLHLRLSFHPA
jgi:serine/threonine-protein kinase RsbW